MMKGNSGGPLFVKSGSGSWVVAGITSTQVLDANQQLLPRQPYKDEIANHWINVTVYLNQIRQWVKANPAPTL
ncbi:MAG: hypothetical protein EOP06_02975 [Proteobacteria bacterium]|nr:MAG: hypothetical protein EOP06_02975 [Pseudomonadota bacterium]